MRYIEGFDELDLISDLERAFNVKLTLKVEDIVIAVYDQFGWEGNALVVFRQDGMLYEVNASHCSCYGLEDQWDPDQTRAGILYHRFCQGLSIFSHHDNDLNPILRALCDEEDLLEEQKILKEESISLIKEAKTDENNIEKH